MFPNEGGVDAIFPKGRGFVLSGVRQKQIVVPATGGGFSIRSRPPTGTENLVGGGVTGTRNKKPRKCLPIKTRGGNLYFQTQGGKKWFTMGKNQEGKRGKGE